MSLSTGRGPLGPNPAGRFSAPMPAAVTYVEPFRRRVRGLVGERIVIDSQRVVLVHRPGRTAAYAFPESDVAGVPSVAEEHTPGYVTVDWDAVDEWFEEDERILGHPRSPYHRIECLRSSRRLRVEVAGISAVDTTSTLVVYETGLEPRLYVSRDLVGDVTLERSDTQTYCPYKGTASYWHARVDETVIEDVAWSYEDPLPESLALAGLVSFDDTRVVVRHDLPDGA